MGFPSLGHFVANQAGFFTFLSQSPKDSPGFLVTAYLFLLALTILVIIIIKKVPFHLIGTSERWINMENRTKPLSTVTVMALIGLLLYNITDSYLSEIKDFSTKELSTLSQSSDFILFESCLMG
ncbi:MAG: hypothetical protein NZM65_10220, partial [Flavobacteriales bacterium]|nr:hypothetical protein [Flavobacteriales bacterium]MDW8411048.1 hypothetical protein [Flavobacteriales bacterium]